MKKNILTFAEFVAHQDQNLTEINESVDRNNKSVYIVRIQLRNLLARNNKKEYNDMYVALINADFLDYAEDDKKNKYRLPPGVYSIALENHNLDMALKLASEQIKRVLSEIGYDKPHNHFTVLVSGPSKFVGQNFDKYDD